MSKTGKLSKYLDGEYSEFVKEVMYKYGSINKFCIAIGVQQANLNSNLNGSYRMSMERMFLCANALRIPVERMIEWFWKYELAENHELRYSEK